MFILQDIFGIVPGDTDYRIFAQDYGKIPGLDVIFLLGGYFYHTSYDTLERLLYALEFDILVHIPFYCDAETRLSWMLLLTLVTFCNQTWKHPSAWGQSV